MNLRRATAPYALDVREIPQWGCDGCLGSGNNRLNSSVLSHQYLARSASGFSCRARRADEGIFKGHGRGGATPPGAKRRGAASKVLMGQDTMILGRPSRALSVCGRFHADCAYAGEWNGGSLR